VNEIVARYHLLFLLDRLSLFLIIWSRAAKAKRKIEGCLVRLDNAGIERRETSKDGPYPEPRGPRLPAGRQGFYSWVNWSSGTGCSPLVGVSWGPRALPVGLHFKSDLDLLAAFKERMEEKINFQV
jgi:hypothetical protein